MPVKVIIFRVKKLYITTIVKIAGIGIINDISFFIEYRLIIKKRIIKRYEIIR